MRRFSGNFILRITPELHQKIYLLARSENLSLNETCARLLHQATQITSAHQKLLSLIQKEFPFLESVCIFGSVARGEQTTGSDIDLLLVLNSKQKITRELYKTWDDKIAPKLDKPFSPQFVCMPEDTSYSSSLWLECAMDAQIIFDSTQNTTRFLSKLRDKIAQGLFVRKLSYGQPYWVHAEDKLLEPGKTS